MLIASKSKLTTCRAHAAIPLSLHSPEVEAPAPGGADDEYDTSGFRFPNVPENVIPATISRT